MDEIDHLFVVVASRQTGSAPTIACLYTGVDMPSSCEPMLRLPEPKIGQVLDISFSDHLAMALDLNTAVHDGAVMLGRDSTDSPYKVSGWSYRLFPNGDRSSQVPNRGSAFNSCLAMSTVRGIDRLYLVTRGLLYRFEKGSAVQLDADQGSLEA